MKKGRKCSIGTEEKVRKAIEGGEVDKHKK